MAGNRKENKMIYYIILVAVLLIMLVYKWREASDYENLWNKAINKLVQTNRERCIQVNADREGVKKQIDDKFLAILRIAEKEDSPKTRFDLGYERGRFEIEVENLWLMGGITYQMKFRLIECGKIASRSEDKGWWFMTHEEQVEAVKKKLDFEKEFLANQIKCRNEARKAYENCLPEEREAKLEEYKTRDLCVVQQHMYISGVISTVYTLKILSREECEKLSSQLMDEVYV